MKLKHPINLHKGLTALAILAMMSAYQNFSTGAWIYLALHGGYGYLWLLKDRIYPDKRWEEDASIGTGIITFLALGLYWVAPWLLISRNVEPAAPLLAIAIVANLLGVFFHYTSDAQKYYTLKYHPGLITEGFFARSRNTNYLGELLIYGSFALLSMHWLSFAILGVFAFAVFLPGMKQKDNSLSKYPDFDNYKAQSGLLLPQFFGTTVTEKPASDQIASEGKSRGI
jgi:protein-S-isoprenylcysteine O-methyltransferase Ste14